jgi:hypothetical protein
MATEFQYDVFLSHNQADKPRVRRLAERLRAAGLRVWFDEWVIQPGDDIYLAIERGLEASRTLVLCLSPAALGSDWVGLERSTVGRGNLPLPDSANAGRHFIPLLLADCKLPDTLRRTTPPAKSPVAANSAWLRRRSCPAKASKALGRRSSGRMQWCGRKQPYCSGQRVDASQLSAGGTGSALPDSSLRALLPRRLMPSFGAI